MKVFVTGASGYIGAHIVDTLLSRGHTVRALQHRRSVDESVPGVETIQGSVTEPDTLRGSMETCDAVIHLVGIIEEDRSKGKTFDALHDRATRNVVDEALRSGIGVFVQMSANGAREDGVSGYQTSKYRAEQYVADAGFPAWTILRPTLVFGDPGGDTREFASYVASTLVKPFPVLPVFGDGLYRQQPVHVSDVATAFVHSVERRESGGRIYCVAGEEEIPYIEVLDRIATGMGIEPKPKLHTPIWLARPVIHAAGKFGLLPISPDQFEMLVEGNICDSTDFRRDFDFSGRRFTPENLSYLRKLFD